MSNANWGTATPWPQGERELDEVRAFNRKLAWLPRFKIRNRLTPRVIQALLRVSQIGGSGALRKFGLTAERKLIANVPVRIIRPKGRAKGVVLDFHGGGWVIGNAQMDDNFNAAIVDSCEVTVVSVDYRLAVSTPIEGLLEDCLNATRWLLQEAEFAGLPVVVVGESAGGHLAAATLLALKQWPDLLQRISGALLYYGVYDLTGTPSVRSAPADTLVLDGPGMVEALRLLTPELTDEQRRQPPLSPLYGDFSGFRRRCCLPANSIRCATTLSTSPGAGRNQRRSRCTCCHPRLTVLFTSPRPLLKVCWPTVGSGFRRASRQLFRPFENRLPTPAADTP